MKELQTLVKLAGVATAIMLLASMKPAGAVGPPIRSTLYNGSTNAYSAFPNKMTQDLGTNMTIEAWVYRMDGDRCETIVGHDSTSSWWFGFCPRLSFARKGVSRMTATQVTVPAYQWTHVAVTYNGTNCTFYVNGNSAGTFPLASSGTDPSRELVIGADSRSTPHVYTNPFSGNIDEVRIWSGVRTQSQISSNRFKELRTGTNLLATFSTGGNTEDITGYVGSHGLGATGDVFGILPRDLIVPKASIRPTVDGHLNVDSEYLGAEQLVLPYNAGPDEPDSIAYLVYDETPPASLFVAISAPRHNTGGWPYSNTTMGVMVDPTYSRTSLPDSTDFYLKTSLGDYDPTGSWLNGDGAGGWVQCMLNSQPCTPPSEYAVGKSLCGFEMGGLPCTEFRIPVSKLGSWDEFDGLAVAHANWNSSGTVSMAPGDASPSNPSTWAKVSYGEGSATLPKAIVGGKVNAGLTSGSPGLAGWRVTLSAGGTAYQTLTNSSGIFSFNEPIAANQTVQLQVDNCGFCIYAAPTFYGTGMSGTVVNDLVVQYPGCPSGTCTYQNVQFYIQQVVGPVSVTGVSETYPTPRVVVRDNPTVVSANAASVVTINGSNFHDQVKVYLSPVAPGLVCPCPDDWELYEATIVDRAGDGSWIKVETPTLPGRGRLRKNGPLGNPFGAGYRWVIYDPWTRPNVVTYNLWPNPQANPNNFHLTEPEYPYLWGFGFENRYDDPGWREFSAVYGTNAYYCLGAFGHCISYVMDPMYEAFFPIYMLVGHAMTGSCGGMASTSLMFKQGILNTQQFDPNVYFPSGFIESSVNFDPTWSKSHLGVLYGPASPTNLWARIRVGQMTQVSNETLLQLASQACLEGDWNPFCGSPASRLSELSPNPIGDIAVILGSFSLAHCVTPYAVSGGEIKVYDNNYPNDPASMTVTGNTVNFPNLGYSGSGLFTFPLSIWLNGRTAPLFGSSDFLLSIVAGGADQMVTTQDGKRWGWLANGTTVNEIPGSVTATPWSDGSYTGRSVPLLLPASKTNPQITVNARGGDYYVHTGGTGMMLQLHAFDSQPGDTDHVNLKHNALGDLQSFEFTPEKTAPHAIPAVGMKDPSNKSVLFRWLNVNVPAGKTAGFGGIKEQLAAQFTNLTGAPSSPYMLVKGVDGAAGQASQVLFEPVSVPNGAAQTVTLLNWPTNTQARLDVDLDRNGTIDQSSVVQGVTPVSVKTPGEAKLLSDGTLVSLDRAVASSGVSAFNGFFYCQDPDRSSGIRVVVNASEIPGLREGNDVQVIGTMATALTGERQIINPLVIISAPQSGPDPLFMTNRSVGGSHFGSPPMGQIGMSGVAMGLNNVGLLVSTNGRVTSWDGQIALITDGSGPVAIDLTNISHSPFEPGAHLMVNGISSIRLENGLRKPVILPRSSSDVTVY